MDIYDSLISSNSSLNEQIAEEIFSIMPDEELFLAILDGQGGCWASDQEEFTKIFTDNEQIQRICASVADGGDPVISRMDDYSIVSAQLEAGETNCGYLIFALDKYTSEATFTSMNLIEFIASQINLIAKLIEKNNRLQHVQLKQLSVVSSN